MEFKLASKTIVSQTLSSLDLKEILQLFLIIGQ